MFYIIFIIINQFIEVSLLKVTFIRVKLDELLQIYATVLIVHKLDREIETSQNPSYAPFSH